MGLPVTDRERRCPSCGALVSIDAGWCGQCLQPLTEPAPPPPIDTAPPEPHPVEPDPTVADESIGEGIAWWPCPVCGGRNALELESCATCGTPFAVVMGLDQQPPKVDPAEAMRWSLVFPGLGHRRIGLGADGIARGVLFTMALLMAVIAASAGLSAPALLGEFVLFLAMAIAVYVATAFEARRLAEGGTPLVSSRTLLWLTVGVVLVSGLILAFAMAGADRR
jgi:hypothetical protein